jgi:hypothetical protein
MSPVKYKQTTLDDACVYILALCSHICMVAEGDKEPGFTADLDEMLEDAMDFVDRNIYK